VKKDRLIQEVEERRRKRRVGGAGVPPPLPVEVIERNRLTLAEILVLPRFRDYTPGEPSKVGKVQQG